MGSPGTWTTGRGFSLGTRIKGTSGSRGPSCGIWMQPPCRAGSMGSKGPWVQILALSLCKAQRERVSLNFSFFIIFMGTALIPLPAMRAGGGSLHFLPKGAKLSYPVLPAKRPVPPVSLLIRYRFPARGGQESLWRR